MSSADAWLDRLLCVPPDVLLDNEPVLLPGLMFVLLAAHPGVLVERAILLLPAKSSSMPPPVMRDR